MPSGPARLLCVGKDLDPTTNSLRRPQSIWVRCGIGYRTGCRASLHTEGFDLVIVSAFLDEWEKGSVFSTAGKSPTLVLRGLILAPDLQLNRFFRTFGADSNKELPTNLCGSTIWILFRKIRKVDWLNRADR
jgi:hypothetical protein